MHEEPKKETSKRILRWPAVEAKTQISRCLAYRKQDPDDALYDSTFPRPIKLSYRAIGWFEDEIDVWLESRRMKPNRKVVDTNL